MELSCAENKPAGRGKAIEELQQGFEIAKQLQILISQSSSGDKDKSSMNSSSDYLLERISNSFSYAISAFNINQFREVNQSPVSMAGRRSEDSERSSKSTTMTEKYRRGCYKRRKTEDARSTETLNWVEDGHSWRKYGQKVILNCKYPRNYYRCTNKSGGCPAKKHVQQIRDPPTYLTTHYGNHTCQDSLKQSEIVLKDDSDYAADSSVLISFDKSSNLKNISSISVKQLDQQNIVDHNYNKVQGDLTKRQPSLSNQYLSSPDEFTASGSFLTSDHADHVISCTANFDMGSFDLFEVDDVIKQFGFQ